MMPGPELSQAVIDTPRNLPPGRGIAMKPKSMLPVLGFCVMFEESAGYPPHVTVSPCPV